MSTLVVFHAHPDDEAIATGGTMAKAAADGHRVVLVVATRGERGEVAEGYLEPGEALWQRRVAETRAAAQVLGVERVEFLGYADSGMMGQPSNDDPASFWQADLEAAARRLAAILDEEAADVLTAYDENGGYGHPDHIQVHRVGLRAGELAGTRKVYMSTISREWAAEGMRRAAAMGIPMPGDLDFDQLDVGVPEARITTRVDVSGFVDLKRKAMAAHGSQIGESSFFLSMPPDLFDLSFGTEWYILVGAAEGASETDLFDGV